MVNMVAVEKNRERRLIWPENLPINTAVSLARALGEGYEQLAPGARVDFVPLSGETFEAMNNFLTAMASVPRSNYEGVLATYFFGSSHDITYGKDGESTKEVFGVGGLFSTEEKVMVTVGLYPEDFVGKVLGVDTRGFRMEGSQTGAFLGVYMDGQGKGRRARVHVSKGGPDSKNGCTFWCIKRRKGWVISEVENK